MRRTTTARLLTNRRSQAVRIPKAYRFEGVSEVLIRMEGDALVLIPARTTWTPCAEDAPPGRRRLPGRAPRPDGRCRPLRVVMRYRRRRRHDRRPRAQSPPPALTNDEEHLSTVSGLPVETRTARPYPVAPAEPLPLARRPAHTTFAPVLPPVHAARARTSALHPPSTPDRRSIISHTSSRAHPAHRPPTLHPQAPTSPWSCRPAGSPSRTHPRPSNLTTSPRGPRLDMLMLSCSCASASRTTDRSATSKNSCSLPPDPKTRAMA